MLQIPTGERQTSWVFTEHGLGFENGATVKQIQVVRMGLEPGTPDYESGALTTRPRRLSVKYIKDIK